MRYTKAFVTVRFIAAMEALGVEHANATSAWEKIPHEQGGGYKARVGVYFIDYAPIYGGYRIGRMHNPGGAESVPFGDSRLSAREFVALLDGISGAMRIVKMRAGS